MSEKVIIATAPSVSPPPASLVNTPGIGLIIGLCAIIFISLLIIRFYLKNKTDLRKEARFIFFVFLSQTLIFWSSSFFLKGVFQFVHMIVFKLINTATILSGAFYINQLIDFYVWRLFVGKHGESQVPTFLKSMITIMIYILSIAIIIKFIFVRDESALIALIGGAVLLLGFSSKEIIAHVFSALALNVAPSFKKGDIVAFDDKFFYVHDMDWRVVTFIDFQNNRYYIPNFRLTNESILNLSNDNNGSKIGIKFETKLQFSPELIIKLVKASLKRMRQYNTNDEIEVFILQMDGGILFVVYLPVQSIDEIINIHRVQTEMFIIIWNILKENNIYLNVNSFDNINRSKLS